MVAEEEVPQIIDGLPLIEAATKLKDEANGHVKSKQFNEAVSLYERGIVILDKADGHPMLRIEVEQMITLKSVLYANLAQCMLNQALFRRAIEAATSSLNCDEGNAKALNRRSQAYQKLNQFPEALADMLALQKFGGGGLSPDAVEERLKVLRDKLAEIQKLKDEESSDDEIGMEMVSMKERFDAVVEKYDLRNDEAGAAEVAEWLTSGEWLVTVKRVAHRWKMEMIDAEDFLKWIAKGVEFKAQQSEMQDHFQPIGAPSALPTD